MKLIRVRQIVELLDEVVVGVHGDTERAIDAPVPLNAKDASRGISFCKSPYPDALPQMRNSSVTTILCKPMDGLQALADGGKTIIAVSNPRLAFIKIVQTFFAVAQPRGIDHTAIIDATASIAPSAYVGPMAYVGPKTTIGENSVINCHVCIYGNTTIGNKVIIHAGTVIGADGFGFERNEEGAFDKFPHLGGVIIEDEVEIGANTCIDRGTLGNTVIKSRTKIDNLVHIAHNVVIEEDCAVIAHAMVAGSVRVGRGSWIAPCASIRESIKVGSKSLVGLGAVVVSEVLEGTTVMGAPAREISEYKILLNAQKALLNK